MKKRKREEKGQRNKERRQKGNRKKKEIDKNINKVIIIACKQTKRKEMRDK